MALLKSQCKKIEEEKGTIGGTTYHITLKGDSNPRALCFRRVKSDDKLFQRCSNIAGFKTDHVGTGACAFHGGASRAHNITTGAGARVTKMRLQEKIDKYLQQDRDRLLDLTYQLAATRAIFDEFMTTFPNPEADNYGINLNRFQGIVGTLSTVVEKISKIENRNTLTTAQVLYLRATVADILMKYLPDPELRERAAKELAARMGGDIEVEMEPREYSLPLLEEQV